jgi:hypothetical protein
MQIINIEIAGSRWPHRESIRRKNLGMNQATAERTNVKLAAASKTPKAMDIAH